MPPGAISTDVIDHYHAHIYFEMGKPSRDQAWALRELIGKCFTDVVVGRFHERIVGPHLYPMFQVAFRTDRFASFVPWLALNHNGLSVLVHPGTGDSVADHTDNAMWIGERLPVNTEVLRGNQERRDREKAGKA
jgi:aromatic ring-cleaving dioxygenase